MPDEANACVHLALHRRRTSVGRVLVRRLQFLFLQVDQRRPRDHEDDLLLLVRCVRDLEFLDADRHQRVIGPRQERRDHAADDLDLAELVGQLRQGRGQRQTRLLLGNRRMVVVPEGRHVIRPFHRLRVPGRKHESLAGDAHERRGAKLNAVVIQQDEPAGVVQAVVETLGRDADRASRGAHERDRVGELKGLGHPLKVHRHLVVDVTLPDLRAGDGVDVGRRHAIRFRHVLSSSSWPHCAASVACRRLSRGVPSARRDRQRSVRHASSTTGPRCSSPSRASSRRTPAARPT